MLHPPKGRLKTGRFRISLGKSTAVQWLWGYTRDFITLRIKYGGLARRKTHITLPFVASLKGLECSKRAENIITRKNIIFYIEAIPQFFPTSKKMGRSIEKLFFSDKKSTFFGDQNRDFQNPAIFDFEIFCRWFSKIFEKLFFESEQIFFRSWKTIWGIASM